MPLPEPVSSAVQQDVSASRTSDVVFTLLRDGLNAIGHNRNAARTCIARAYALLEAQREFGATSSAALEKVRASGGLTPWQVHHVKAHIDEHLSRRITTAEMSPAARLSPGHFARAFRRNFGVTPHVYVFQRRVSLAKQLMLTTDEPLSRIAAACGFADQSHFSRRFQQAVGVTPNAWRREHRQTLRRLHRDDGESAFG